MSHEPAQLNAVVAGDSLRRVIRVQGDLVVGTATLVKALTAQLVRDGCRSIRLDLSDVTAADPLGVRALRDLGRPMRAAGVAVAVINVPSCAR